MDAKAAKKRTRTERGAVAIMVGLMATALFGVAALAVDLGNAWARKREVQKQVDVSALSVGWLLPMHPSNKQAIADKVAAYFNDHANDVVGQASVTGSQLINHVSSDGEITFQHEDGTTCTDNCPQMRVLGPAAKVTAGLAAVLGIDSVNVQTSATVRIASELPPKSKTIPFWLPTGCGFGPAEADTTQGNGNQVTTPSSQPTVSPTATPTAAASPYSPTPVGEHTLSGAAVSAVGYDGATTISGYSVSGVASQYKKVTLRAYPPTGTAFVDFAAQTAGNGAVPSFPISKEISDTVGDWRVYALAQKNNDTQYEYSSNYLVIRVNPPAVAPSATPTPTADPTAGVVVGCVGQDRGNFGQLDSPRVEGGTKQARLAMNIAVGIDHSLVPYVFAPGQSERKDCGAPEGGLLLGAHLDNISADGNNCIIGDTGNDGPKMMDGMVQGISGGIPGRLDIANGGSVCPNRSNVVIAGKLINNDVLSCYLRHGATLTDIAQPGILSNNMLDPSVVNSPRFVWLPVVYATDRAQRNFQPIRQFVPGFITDETQTTGATSTNGLEINGNSISVLHIYTFNSSALPPIENSDTVDYNPDIGGAIVRLVG
jgi:Flp pilus assembly protein TadG